MRFFYTILVALTIFFSSTPIHAARSQDNYELQKLVALTTFLSSTRIHAARSQDTYEFQKAEYQKSEIDVKLVTYPDKEAFRQAKLKYGLTNEVRAFSELTKTTCTIHIIAPEKKYEPELLGHELTHCFFGNFHDDSR